MIARKIAMVAALLLVVACSEPAPSTEASAETTSATPASGTACTSPSARVEGQYEERWRGAELLEATPGTTTCVQSGQAATFNLTCAVRGPANLALDGYLFHTVPEGRTATYVLDANGSATCTLN